MCSAVIINGSAHKFRQYNTDGTHTCSTTMSCIVSNPFIYFGIVIIVILGVLNVITCLIIVKQRRKGASYYLARSKSKTNEVNIEMVELSVHSSTRQSTNASSSDDELDSDASYENMADLIDVENKSSSNATTKSNIDYINITEMSLLGPSGIMHQTLNDVETTNTRGDQKKTSSSNDVYTNHYYDTPDIQIIDDARSMTTEMKETMVKSEYFNVVENNEDPSDEDVTSLDTSCPYDIPDIHISTDDTSTSNSREYLQVNRTADVHPNLIQSVESKSYDPIEKKIEIWILCEHLR